MRKNICKWIPLPILVTAVSAMAAPESVAPTFVSVSYPLKHATGLVRTQATVDFLAQAPRASFVDTRDTVPQAYSLRGNAGPVENQGECGSCWDFALTTTLRGTWMLAGKDPGRLSFNYLLNCATTMKGCDGGDFNAAQYFVTPKGAPAYGDDGNYTGKAGKCAAKPAIASTETYRILGDSRRKAPSFKDVAYVIGVLHQPVTVDVAVDKTWESYRSGVFNKCATKKVRLNHMVTIEGYDCETAVDGSGNCTFDSQGNLPGGVGRWIIRNSWGTQWGDNGYITTKATTKDRRLCNSIASTGLYFELGN